MRNRIIGLLLVLWRPFEFVWSLPGRFDDSKDWVRWTMSAQGNLILWFPPLLGLVLLTQQWWWPKIKTRFRWLESREDKLEKSVSALNTRLVRIEKALTVSVGVFSLVPPPQDQAEGRVFISTHPMEIGRLYSEHSQIAADKLFEPYIDKWWSISTKVESLNSRANGGISLHCDRSWAEQFHVFAEFQSPEAAHVESLRIGDKVRFLGQIKSANALYVNLEQCEVFKK